MVHRNALTVCSLFLLLGQAVADDSQRHQQVGGMDIYLGVLPAQITQAQHPNMHGATDGDEHRYHLLVALFDSKSDERITDARVKATVAQLGMEGKTKALALMGGELLSYGNYFAMHKPDYYRIGVEIQRAGSGGKSVAKFVFQRPRD